MPDLSNLTARALGSAPAAASENIVPGNQSSDNGGERRRRSGLISSLVEKFGTIIVVVGLAIYFGLAAPGGTFFTANNFSSILQTVSVLGVVAAGLTVVLVLGAFDLSIAGNAALAGLIAATVAVNTQNTAVAALVAIAIAGGIGLVNGILATKFGVPPFIGTLSMGLFIVVGIQQKVAPNGTVSGGLPESFGALGRSKVLGLPAVAVVAALVLLAVWFFLRHTSAGRRMHAVGGNIEAARLAGVRVIGIQVLGYTICGLCAGLGGFLNASVFNLGSAQSGSSLLLDAFTACFVGASTLAAGRFHIPGTAIGVFTLGMLTNGLTLAGWSNSSVPIAKGALLIVAVAVAGVMRRRRA